MDLDACITYAYMVWDFVRPIVERLGFFIVVIYFVFFFRLLLAYLRWRLCNSQVPITFKEYYRDFEEEDFDRLAIYFIKFAVVILAIFGLILITFNKR